MKKNNKKNKSETWFEAWAKNNKYSIGFCAKIIIPLFILVATCIITPYINAYLNSKNVTVDDSDDKVVDDGRVKSGIASYESNFIDNKWTEDKRWIQNEQEFVFIPDETKKGGPKMDFKDLANDNFRLTLEFEPVTNENNKNNEINLVIHIGDLYEIVLGDGNRKNFYLKSDGKYISEIKTKLNIIPFEHPIMFDEWTRIEINQDVSNNSKTRSIKVSFYYCPFIFGKYGCNKNQPEIYLFEIDDSSDPEKVLRLISIGLRNSSSVIKTKLYYFELENR